MYHRTTIAGRISWMGELTQTQSGRQVLNFQVAVDTSYKDGNGKKVDQAEFYTCTVWNGAAQSVATYKSVGDPVLVEGRMQFDRNEENGQLVGFWPKLVAQRVQFLPGGSRNGGAPDPQSIAQPQQHRVPVQEEAVPF